jgi:large subunit ribosomal protein L21
MEYAVIQIGGKQYKAEIGSILEIDKVNAESGNTYKFDNVLLYVKDGESKIGTPMLDGINVTGKILDQVKGEKIRVAKFKAKARYRRVQGFRHSLTRVQITSITSKQQSAKPEFKEETIKKSVVKNKK